MSLTEFTSGNNGTRPIEAGDTPDIQDDYAVSIPMKDNVTINKGDITQVFAGKLQEALLADILNPLAPAVSTETKVNPLSGTLEQRCITAGQMIALLNASVSSFTLQQYAQIQADGIIQPIPEGVANTTHRKYARYVGKEGAIFERKATTAFDETLSVGIVPDQTLLTTEIGWFQLVESAL